jgi:hypothetical protein
MQLSSVHIGHLYSKPHYLDLFKHPMPRATGLSSLLDRTLGFPNMRLKRWISRNVKCHFAVTGMDIRYISSDVFLKGKVRPTYRSNRMCISLHWSPLNYYIITWVTQLEEYSVVSQVSTRRYPLLLQ